MSSSLEGSGQTSGSGNPNDTMIDYDLNTFLMVSDDQGHLHAFMDGSYPQGMISLCSDASEMSVASVFFESTHQTFLAHPQVQTDMGARTDLYPTTVHLPLLEKRDARDMGRLSSTARELVWYVMRVIKDMRVVWFGSEVLGGARELGPKWIRALETRQKEKFGRSWACVDFEKRVITPSVADDEPNPLLDLTCLLVTGRASDALADFLGSSEQMSERVPHNLACLCRLI